MIVAGMSTIPPREGTLQAVVGSITKQVDQLIINFNQDRAPAWLKRYKNVRAIFAKDTRVFDVSGKFVALTHCGDSDVFVGVDDDIIYPHNYIKRMVEFLEAMGTAVVTVHGSTVNEPITSYIKLKKYRFNEALLNPKRVHLAGTGTVMFRQGDLRLNRLTDFPYYNCGDLCLSLRARERDMNIWAINRAAGWLKPIKTSRSIFDGRLKGWDWMETLLLQEARPWERL